LIEKVEELIDFENEFRKKYLLERCMPNLEEIDLYRTNLKKIKNEFYQLLSKSFHSIQS